MGVEAKGVNQTIDLKETVSFLLSRLWLIAAVTAIVTAGSVGLSMGQTPVYCTTATAVIRPVVPPAALNWYSNSSAGPLGLDVEPESEAQIARSGVVVERVAKDLRVTARALPGWISVRVVTNHLLGFTGCSTRPAAAAQVAQTFAEGYLAYRREGAARTLATIADQMKQQVDGANRDIAALDTQILRVSQRIGTETDPTRRQAATTQFNQLSSDRNQAQLKLASMQGRYNDIQGSLRSASVGGGEVVQAAVTPTAPTRPKPMRDGALGFVLGGLMGVGAAFLSKHFDSRIHNLSDASRAVGALVIGVTPRASKRRVKKVLVESAQDPGSPVAEAYRALRQSLAVMGVGSEFKTVLITSGGPGAGKTTTAANLGVAFARTGVRTILVSADLHRARLHTFFNVANEVGVGDVLAGTAALDTIEMPSILPNLWLLPSGSTPGNPAELLDSARLAVLLERLRDIADVVIVDGPPLAAGADVMVLARYADVALLLMRQDRAHAVGAKAAVNELTKAGAARVAAVLTLVHGKLGGYGYGKYRHGYGYGYGYGDGKSARGRRPPSSGQPTSTGRSIGAMDSERETATAIDG